MNNSLLTTFLASKVSLTSNRYEDIKALYLGIYEAVEDNFKKLNCKNKEWLKPWFAIENYKEKIKFFEEELQNNSTNYLTIENVDYPAKLKYLTNSPVVLYYQGNLELLKIKELITVVGSRMIDHYSRKLIHEIIPPLSKIGVGVISGLAMGVDQQAHKNALENNGKTIAVIGSGLADDYFYPRKNLGLKRDLVNNQNLILSEYPPNTAASNFTFPQRNRILAALSDLTWVVQANNKSGSLITAGIARDLGKTVATTPANIFEKSFEGNLSLLKDGCQIITNYQDVIDLLGLKTHPELSFDKKEIIFNSSWEEKVYNILSFSPILIEEISELTSMTITEVSQNLTMLELSSYAICVGENLWIRS